jgi:uncharacterized protein (DUF2062 family)
MPRRFLNRYVPNPATVREYPALKPLGKLLHNPEIWHLHRRSVGGAFFIGLFCAFLPIPFQMLVAAILAIGFRCNLPVAVVLVWVTNPITFGPIFYFAYKLGAWLLDMELTVTAIEPSFDWLAVQFNQIWQPLLLGSLLCGWVVGVTGFVVIRVVWRLHVLRRWRSRRERRARRRAAPQQGSAPPHAVPGVDRR